MTFIKQKHYFFFIHNGPHYKKTKFGNFCLPFYFMQNNAMKHHKKFNNASLIVSRFKLRLSFHSRFKHNSRFRHSLSSFFTLRNGGILNMVGFSYSFAWRKISMESSKIAIFSSRRCLGCAQASEIFPSGTSYTLCDDKPNGRRFPRRGLFLRGLPRRGLHLCFVNMNPTGDARFAYMNPTGDARFARLKPTGCARNPLSSSQTNGLCLKHGRIAKAQLFMKSSLKGILLVNFPEKEKDFLIKNLAAENKIPLISQSASLLLKDSRNMNDLLGVDDPIQILFDKVKTSVPCICVRADYSIKNL